jgi:hypothetical protein
MYIDRYEHLSPAMSVSDDSAFSGRIVGTASYLLAAAPFLWGLSSYRLIAGRLKSQRQAIVFVSAFLLSGLHPRISRIFSCGIPASRRII